MKDFFFGIKMLVVATAIILVMQIRVADTTLEDRFEYWSHHSEISNFLEGTASGAVRLGKDTIDWTSSWSNKHFGWPEKTKERSQTRRSFFELKRSDASGYGDSSKSRQ